MGQTGRLLSEYEQPANAPAVRSLVAKKMQKPKLTGLSEDQVQNIAKALADPRRQEIVQEDQPLRSTIGLRIRAGMPRNHCANAFASHEGDSRGYPRLIIGNRNRN